MLQHVAVFRFFHSRLLIDVHFVDHSLTDPSLNGFYFGSIMKNTAMNSPTDFWMDMSLIWLEQLCSVEAKFSSRRETAHAAAIALRCCTFPPTGGKVSTPLTMQRHLLPCTFLTIILAGASADAQKDGGPKTIKTLEEGRNKMCQPWEPCNLKMAISAGEDSNSPANSITHSTEDADCTQGGWCPPWEQGCGGGGTSTWGAPASLQLPATPHPAPDFARCTQVHSLLPFTAHRKQL